jgi:hypothetical protein
VLLINLNLANRGSRDAAPKLLSPPLEQWYAAWCEVVRAIDPATRSVNLGSFRPKPERRLQKRTRFASWTTAFAGVTTSGFISPHQ